jgi:lipoprotein-anchoring transpeptidase ErfK/SrfK
MKNKLVRKVHSTYKLINYNIKEFLNNFRNNTTYLSKASNFINSGNFSSPTYYFIWVDTKNFKTNIYKGSKNHWTLIHSYLCTIGKPSTPTPKGNFHIGVKGLYFGVEKGFKARYYTQFYGNYLFHSILYNLNGSIRDGRLGMTLSDGCIRLSLANAKWIWDNIPKNTSVFIS